MALRVKRLVLRVKGSVNPFLRVKPTVLRVKQKYYNILMNCFTRKTLVGANRVRIHLLCVKPIVLCVKPTGILRFFAVEGDCSC